MTRGRLGVLSAWMLANFAMVGCLAFGQAWALRAIGWLWVSSALGVGGILAWAILVFVRQERPDPFPRQASEG